MTSLHPGDDDKPYDWSAEAHPRAFLSANHPDIRHRDGILWCDAPKPPLNHRCEAWSEGWIQGAFYERCACGAKRLGRRGWFDKNSENQNPAPPLSKLRRLGRYLFPPV